jgi:PAS domain S-box-containing protein
VVRQEYEETTSRYFEIYSHMENKVAERTRELEELHKRLETKGQELQLIIDSSPDIIYYKDVAGRYVRVNRTFIEAFGTAMEDVLGKTDSEVFAGEADTAFTDDREVLETGVPELNRHTVIQTPGGNRPVKADKIPYRDSEGKPAGVIGFLMDLTEIQRAEQEKQDLRERVARAEKMQALGILAGGIAHDSNNILAGITGYIQLVLMDLSEDDVHREYLECALGSANRMAELVQDLLALARRGLNDTAALDLNEVVSQYLGSITFDRLKAAHPETDVCSRLEPGLRPIRGKAAQLEKVLMNLVSNALEAISGKGKVVVSTYGRHVDRPIKAYDLTVEEGEFCVLEVSDTGSGISGADLSRIFEPFYTRKVLNESGTGLGLAVVYGIVKDHNGFIDVTSEEGAGTTFTVYFPAADEPLESQDETSPDDAFHGRGETILVVDDIPQQRQIASAMLLRLGFRPVAVAGGEEAVDYAREHPVDALLLDMILDPGIDGLETYQRILQVRPGTPAVLASGYAKTERVRQTQALGAGEYLQKPFTVQELGSALATVLSRR